MIKKTHTHTHEGTSYASGTIILMITRYCIEAEEATLSRPTRRQPDGHTCDIKGRPACSVVVVVGTSLKLVHVQKREREKNKHAKGPSYYQLLTNLPIVIFVLFLTT